MNTHTNQTQIDIDPAVPLVRITRELDAAVANVFRAHTDADLFAQWNGPSDSVMRVDHHDCRTGGSYRYTITSGDFEAGFRGSSTKSAPTR